jgi:nucleoside-diphosphate-sugar epimerase
VALFDRVLVLGCGYAGLAIARLARDRGHAVLAHTRGEARAATLRGEDFDVHVAQALDGRIDAVITRTTLIVVAFPPDGATDARVAPSLARGAGLIYISSTSVYGEHRGVVDDLTPLPATSTQRAAMILDAERAYRDAGAIVFRCPGLYGKDRGLHVRVQKGEHRVPGDGTRYLSRIHVQDLAQLALAAGGPSVKRPDTFVVGDLEPAPHVEVVRFIAREHGVNMPPSVPLESVHESLRADRRVDPSRALAAFPITFTYPTYREGMSRAATEGLKA